MKLLLEAYVANLGFALLFQDSALIRNASFSNSVHIPNTGKDVTWLISDFLGSKYQGHYV